MRKKNCEPGAVQGDGNFQLVALSASGAELGRKDLQGTRYTAKDIAQELAKQDDYAPAFKPRRAAGGLATGGQEGEGR